MGDGSAAALLWLIVCVALVTVLAWWGTRFVARRGGFSGGFGPGGLPKDLEVRGQLPLGRDQRLVLVRAGERWLLLGVTAAGISMVAEFTPEEAARWRQDPPETGAAPSFREALLTILKQGKERR